MTQEPHAGRFERRGLALDLGPTGQAVTLAAAAAGGLAFQSLHVPGGAMSGSILTVALMSYFNLVTPLGNLLRLIAMAITGTSIGSALEPATFAKSPIIR